MSVSQSDSGPLVGLGGRVPVGSAPRAPDDGGLSPLERRPFLLRFAEPIPIGKHTRTGATPAQTTGGDGQSEESREDFSSPDYEP